MEIQLSYSGVTDKVKGIEELDELVIVVRDLQSLENAKDELAKLDIELKKKVSVYSLGQYARILHNTKATDSLGDKLFERSKQDSSTVWRKDGEKSGEDLVD